MKALHLLCVCAALSIPCLGQAPQPRPSAPPDRPPLSHFPPSLRDQARMRQPYDPSKEETIKAKVLEVKELVRGPNTIVALVVETDGKEAQIALGPKEFLKENKIAFAKGDEIIIKGMLFDASSREDMTRGRYGRRAGDNQRSPEDPGDKGDKKDAGDAEAGASAIKNDDKKAGETGEDKAPDGQKPLKPSDNSGKADPDKNKGDATELQRIRIRTREVIKGKQSLVLLNSEGRFVWTPERPERDVNSE